MTVRLARQLEIDHVWATYDAPILDPETGIPDIDEWTSSEVRNRTPWGHLEVWIDGVDYTLFRDKPTEIPGWEKAEPYSDRNATLRFPQLPAFGPIPAWLKEKAVVVIRRRRPDNTSELGDILFTGYVKDRVITNGVWGAEVNGVLYQANEYVRAPADSDTPIDIGALIANRIFMPANRPHYLFEQMAEPSTGIVSTDKGAWDEGLLQYCDRLLSETIQANGDQMTVRKTEFAPGPTPQLVWKDRTTAHWSVTYGTRGVKDDLMVSGGNAGYAIYAEGEDESGNQWRNAFPSADGEGVYYQPVSYDTAVHQTDEEADGDLVETPARLDLTKLRKELYINMGHMSLGRAKTVLENERLRLQAQHVMGTINLEIDPEEGSALEIEAGDNLRLRYFMGTGATGLLLHITQVSVTKGRDRHKVTLTVDTGARDNEYLQQLLDRQRDAENPLKRLQVGRETAVKKDSLVVWDANRSGWIPEARSFPPHDAVWGPLAAGAWHSMQVRASEKDAIQKLDVTVAPEARYFFGFCDRQPTLPPDAASDWPTDPFAEGAWDGDLPAGFLDGWGGYGQGAGYHGPLGSLESEGAPQTGRLIVEKPWNVSHEDEASGPYAYVWAVIFIESGGGEPYNVHGRFWRSRAS